MEHAQKVLLLKSGVNDNSGANRKVVIHATVYVRALLKRVVQYVALYKSKKKKKINTIVFTQTKGNAHV